MGTADDLEAIFTFYLLFTQPDRLGIGRSSVLVVSTLDVQMNEHFTFLR